MKNLRIFCTAASLAILAGCGESGGPSVKIGLNAELTGEMPAVGASSKNAAELFASEINAAGGIDVGGTKLPLKLVVGDNGAKADQARTVAQRLISQDNVLAMVGGFVAAWVTRLSRSQSVTVAIETGVQNATLALMIGSSVLGNDALGLPGAIYGVMMYAGGIAFAFWVRRFTAA